MRGWRLPAAVTAVLLLAQLFRTTALFDVATGEAPADLSLHFPILHAVFAPFTLLADYLNGGSVSDLTSFAIYAVLAYVLIRLPRLKPFSSELRFLSVFLVCFALFLWWGARWSRPIARLVAADSSLLIFDTHTHTTASHDGRKGFDAAANAAWHRAAGFGAAFVTDHNTCCAATQPRLLRGEELSLSGLHMIVLGTDTAISNRPWNDSFDSSLTLIRMIGKPEDSTRAGRPFVIASLPEYSRDHWGADLGRVIEAGAGGLEIWTTSPKAMEFPPYRRREVIARARSLGVALFGATDMHGLGYAATVWNVMPMAGWQGLADSVLARELIGAFRSRPGDIRVIARRRAIGESGVGRAFAFPLGLLATVRSATPAHLASLLAWLWLPVILLRRRAG